MKTFKKNWNNRIVKDDGCYMSKEAKSFVTAMKNMLKRELAPYKEVDPLELNDKIEDEDTADDFGDL